MTSAAVDNVLKAEAVAGQGVVRDEANEGVALRGGDLAGKGVEPAAEPAQTLLLVASCPVGLKLKTNIDIRYATRINP